MNYVKSYKRGICPLNFKNKVTMSIDDWRRYLELDTLIHNKEITLNCLTVYLDKDGVEEYSGTKATESFEGQISPDGCDIYFKYTSDWSNQQDIIDLIKNKLSEK